MGELLDGLSYLINDTFQKSKEHSPKLAAIFLEKAASKNPIIRNCGCSDMLREKAFLISSQNASEVPMGVLS